MISREPIKSRVTLEMKSFNTFLGIKVSIEDVILHAETKRGQNIDKPML